MQCREACSGCAHQQEVQHILCVYISVCRALFPKLRSRNVLWQALKMGNLGKDLQPKPISRLILHTGGREAFLPGNHMQTCAPPEERCRPPLSCARSTCYAVVYLIALQGLTT